MEYKYGWSVQIFVPIGIGLLCQNISKIKNTILKKGRINDNKMGVYLVVELGIVRDWFRMWTRLYVDYRLYIMSMIYKIKSLLFQ